MMLTIQKKKVLKGLTTKAILLKNIHFSVSKTVPQIMGRPK